MKNLLITGATGFIGRNAAAYLAARGYHVVGTYRHTPPIGAADQIQYVQVDLTDAEQIESSLSNRHFDAVLHLAGQMGVEKHLLMDYVSNTVLATENLLRFAEKSKVRQILYASSIAVYGYAGEIVSENSDRVSPNDYGIAKYLCERLLEDAAIPSRVALRLPRTLGKGVDLSYPWLPALAGKLLRGETVYYHNPEMLYNNVEHVDNLCAFLVHLLEQCPEGYRVIGLASSEPMRVIDIVCRLKSSLHSKSELIERTENLPRPTCLQIDIGRAVQAGFAPYTVSQALDAFANDLIETGVGKLG